MNATSYDVGWLRTSSRSHVTDDTLELLSLLPINNRSSRVGFNNQSSIYYTTYYVQQLDATKQHLLWPRGCASFQGTSMPGMLFKLPGVYYLESCALRQWGQFLTKPRILMNWKYFFLSICQCQLTNRRPSWVHEILYSRLSNKQHSQ